MTRSLYSELRTLYETTEAEPNTFRQTIKLRDLVDGWILKEAVDKTMKRYPYFQVRLRMAGGKPVFEPNPAPVPVLHTNQRTVLGSAETSEHLICFCFGKTGCTSMRITA